MAFEGRCALNPLPSHARKIVPTTALRVGDIVICDNLPSHKVAGVREAIEARGASLLYRTVEALWDTVGRLLATFKPGECAGYLRHCGYALRAIASKLCRTRSSSDLNFASSSVDSGVIAARSRAELASKARSMTA
jgi:hypothetical protein